MVGSPYEFDFTAIKTTDFPLFGPDSHFTDDTVMTVANMEAMILSTTSDAEFLRLYKKWYSRYPRCGFSRRFREFIRNGDLGQGEGNGAAMRVSPIALKLSGDKMVDVVRASTRTTHDSPDGHLSALTVAELISKKCMGHGRYFLPWKLEAIRSTTRFSTRAIDTVPIAIACATEAADFTDAIRLAISMGSDTDTVASIAGAIAGAWYGVPRDLIEFVRPKLTGEILEVVDRF